MIDLYYTSIARAHIAMRNTLEKLAQKSKKHLAKSPAVAAAMVFAGPAFSQGVEGILNNGETLIRKIVDFIMVVAVLMGVGGIVYGLKLIMDKSNDRENVKNSHIALSLVGGAFLLVLWFVVTALAESTGGGSLGQKSSW